METKVVKSEINLCSVIVANMPVITHLTIEFALKNFALLYRDASTLDPHARGVELTR